MKSSVGKQPLNPNQLVATKKIAHLVAKREIGALIEILKQGEDWYLADAAAKALGEIGDGQAIEPLLNTISTLSDRLVRATDDAYRMAVRDDSELSQRIRAMKETRKSAEAALLQIGKSGVPSLIAALEGDAWAAPTIALGQIGDSQAVEPLVAILYDKDKLPRLSVIVALGQIGDARAVESLIGALDTHLEHIRKAVTLALFRIGSPAVDALTSTLKHEDYLVRWRVAEALKEIQRLRNE